MSKTLTFIYVDDWEMLFADDEFLADGHSLSGKGVAHALQGVEYDEIRSWGATTNDFDFVEYMDQIPPYLHENGVEFLFD